MNQIFNLTNIKSEFKRSFRLALPLIASEIIFALNAFIATIMVAHLGKEQLAANALSWNIYLAVSLFFFGILCAISILVAQSFGAKDQEGISICFKQGLIMAFLFSIPMMLILWITPEILALTKQDPKVITHAKALLHALALSAIPFSIMVVIFQFLIGITKSRLVMIMSIMDVPLQIFFYYAFLFGKFGFPKVGLAGIGYGLTAAYTVVSILFIGYLKSSKHLKHYNLFDKWWVIDRKFFAEIFRVGLPQGTMWCSELLFFASVAFMMGILGTATLAAYQIANQFLMIALVILFAMSHNAAIRVGNEVGRNNLEQLKLTTAVNTIIGLGLMLIFSILYLSFPQIAISIDIDINSKQFQDVTLEALKFFPLVSIILLSDSIRIIMNGALRGLKDTHFQLIISVIGFWTISFPLCYLLSFKLGFGGVGLWWGDIIGITVTGILLIIRFNRLVKRVDLSSMVTKK